MEILPTCWTKLVDLLPAGPDLACNVIANDEAALSSPLRRHAYFGNNASRVRIARPFHLFVGVCAGQLSPTTCCCRLFFKAPHSSCLLRVGPARGLCLYCARCLARSSLGFRCRCRLALGLSFRLVSRDSIASTARLAARRHHIKQCACKKATAEIRHKLLHTRIVFQGLKDTKVEDYIHQ